MSVLSNKDIYDFAKLVNSTIKKENKTYSIAGTVKKINDDIEWLDDVVDKTAEVLLDGSTDSEENYCRASYNSIVVAEKDRVVVTIEDGTATITENYTNPNGNTLITREALLDKGGEGYFFTLVDGQTTAYTLDVKEDVYVPEGYNIVGLKSVDIEYDTKNVHDQAFPGNWDKLDELYLFAIHLASWSFNGNTIELRYGAQTLSSGSPNLTSSQFRVRFKIIFRCIIATSGD